MNASKIISGTWGTIWKDGVEMADATAMQAKVSYSYQSITQLRQMMEDRKLIGMKGTGSITVNHVYTRSAETLSDAMKGHDARFSIVCALADPDSYGYERVALYGVSYDEATLADFAAGKPGTMTMAFAFTGCEFLDKIEVQ